MAPVGPRKPEDGHAVNEKRIRRLMRLMPIYQKPDTSKPAKGHKTYPYLLGGLRVERPNQVWCADITYLPMRKGFPYLVAIMDRFTDPRLMSDYIDARADTELREWDVLFASAQKADATSANLSGIDMRAFGRSVGEPDLRQGVLAISGTSRRVGSPGDERVGLTKEQIDAATNTFREERIRDGKPVPETLPPRIFCEVRGRHPLIILRFVEPVVPDELKAKSPGLVLAWSICFPPSDVQGGTVEYIVNTIRMREMFGEDEIEEEALGDTD